MGAMVILIKSFVADYCNKSNRHQEKTMPETVFFITHKSNSVILLVNISVPLVE